MKKENRKENKKVKLPDTCMFEVSSIGKSGELIARTVKKEDNPDGVKIYVIENRRIKPALHEGDKFIGKYIIKRDTYYTKPITRVAMAENENEKIYGVIEKKDNQYYLIPADKKANMPYLLDKRNKAQEGDFVKVELVSGARKFKKAEVIKNFGPFDLNKASATLILEKYGIPMEFDAAAIKETQSLPKFHIKGREDLRKLPLVTIDGDDSKDFDDAVYAQKIEKGYLLIVAIADVAFYVQENTPLDREAYKRGNSVYLPNIVIPMLPEILSNDLCSLRPKEDRASIACIMEIDMEGNIVKYDFKRSVIKSVARLTYNEVQEAIDGKKNETTAPIYNTVIKPLYEAFQVLERARQRRGALELELEEIKVKVDKNGAIKSIEKEEVFTSHKIVEEFMIAANVCAAKVLGKTKLPTMYRVHEKPQEEKLKDIQPLLCSLGLKLPEQPALKPSHFNKVLDICKQKGYSAGISDLILRLQSQARYSPDNIGHFGLWLTDYAHFTSPIRRYSDLLIHRALIRAYDMPDGGALEEGATNELFKEIGDHLCVTERRAVNAERDTVSRFLSAYLEPSIGNNFEVKVSGLSTAGIFVRVESIGAEGLIPMRSLPDDDYKLDQCSLSGSKTKLVFAFGDKITAELKEASPLTGGLIFKYVDGECGTSYFEKGGGFGGYKARSGKKETSKKNEKSRGSAKKAKKERIKKANKEKKKKK